MKTTILLGSVRDERQSHKAALYLKKSLEKRKIETSLIDLAELQLPILTNKTKFPVPVAKTVEAISKKLEEADSLIFVSPEYHGSFSGVIKNAVDYFWSEFQKKPIGVVTTSSGNMAGINASSQLQLLILSLGAFPLPLKFLIPKVHEAFDEGFEPVHQSLENAADRFLDEFLWLSEAIIVKKNN